MIQSVCVCVLLIMTLILNYEGLTVTKGIVAGVTDPIARWCGCDPICVCVCAVDHDFDIEL